MKNLKNKLKLNCHYETNQRNPHSLFIQVLENMIDDIVVDYAIHNNYDESFDNEIKNLAQQMLVNII